jgi:putative colanic acid biosynthesis UDP-glucose lipid carrier transferase
MTVNDIPIVAFFKRVLDPFMIWGLLILITWANGKEFTGFYMVLAIITFFISSYVHDQTRIYRNWRNGRLLAYIRDTIIGWLVIVATLVFIGYSTRLSYRYSEKVILTWFIVTPFALIISHILLLQIANKVRSRGYTRTAVIVGANFNGRKLADRIHDYPYLCIDLRGFFDDRDEIRKSTEKINLLGGVADVAGYVREHNIHMIFISLPMAQQPRIRKLLDELHDSTASIYFLPDVNIFELMQARFDNVGGVPVVAICESPFYGVDSVLKDVSDFIFALMALILLAPFMICIALAIKLESPGPAIFKQRRYGLNGEEIIVYKFRSMKVTEDGSHITQAQRNDPRLTRLGAFLRRSSLDELPQFINVLQGQMSVVGPRPHAVAHNELYRKVIKGYMLRHKVKPGITGWAQVNGLRGETSSLDQMKARIEYDLAYVQNWSLSLDTWIIIRTVWVSLRQVNAY